MTSFVPEEHFRLLVESVRDYAIFMLDPSGRVSTWNAGAQSIKGYAPDEIIGKDVSAFYVEEDRAARKPAHLLAAAASEGRVEDEGWRLRKDGSRFWAHAVITALRDHAGQLVGFAKVTRDLTERVRADAELRQADELLRATLYSIGDGVLATDEEARITIINRVAEGLTGWPESEAMGRHVDDVFDIVNEETRARAVNPVARVLQEGTIVGLANHTALVSRDGSERPIADSGAPIRDTLGRTRGAVLVFRDVSDERRAEEALRQSEERLRLMVASVRDYAIFMLDSTGHVATWNQGAEQIKGYRKEEVLGAHFSRFYSPEDVGVGKPRAVLEEAARSGRFEEQAWRIRKDGSRFWASVVINAVRNEAGELIGFTKVTRDLTERRKADELRERLAQAREAVRVVREFLSIASHELKTPITALQLQLEGLADRVATDERLASKVAKAAQSGSRLAVLVETLLDVSRLATGEIELKLESFDLGEVAREIIELVRVSAKQTAADLSYEAASPVIGRWDRVRIEQLVTNLLRSAIWHGAGSPIALSVTSNGYGAELQLRAPAASSGAEGFGLGLYLARQIAEAHGGSIEPKELGPHAVCFVVRLPSEPVAR